MVLPVPVGLRFQAVHSDDVAEAVRLAVLNDVSGAFNIAADPVIDKSVLGELMEARTITVPAKAAIAAVGGAWRLRLLPTDDALLSLLLALPQLDSERARAELGWTPRRSGVEALREMLDGRAGPPNPSSPTVPEPIRAAPAARPDEFVIPSRRVRYPQIAPVTNRCAERCPSTTALPP